MISLAHFVDKVGVCAIMSIGKEIEMKTTYIVLSTEKPANTDNVLFVGTVDELIERFGTGDPKVAAKSFDKAKVTIQKHSFVIGDGVSHGHGGDSYPATVISTTPGGVTIQADQHHCVKKMSAYGADDAEFVYSRNREGPTYTFSVRKNGNLYPAGSNGRYGALGRGRYYRQNPSF